MRSSKKIFNNHKNHVNLFELAKSWIGVKFRWHGYTRSGCDCVGLIAGILLENKIATDKDFQTFHSIKYGTNLELVNKQVAETLLNKYFTEINKLDNGCLILAKTRNSPMHFMIYGIENQQASIIHATAEVGAVFQQNCDYNTHNNIINFCEIVKIFRLKSNGATEKT